MDLQILQWINEHLHGVPFWNMFFKYITYLGEFGAFWIALGVLFLVFKRTRRAGILILIALVIDYLLVDLLLKHTVNRIRPFLVDESLANFIRSIGYRLPTDSSFPSGHSSAGFSVATLLFLIDKKKFWGFAVLALTIALSRLFLCVHYPTDVLSGILIGIAIGCFVYFVSKKFRSVKKND